MNPILLLSLAQDHHRQLLAEAETQRLTCRPPKPIKVVLPTRHVALGAVSTKCLTC